MSQKHEDVREALYVYCLVDFGTHLDAAPRCWVMPSAIVADALVVSYQTWLRKPGKGGKPHKDYPGRRLRPDYTDIGLHAHGPGWMDAYAGNWGLIAAGPPVPTKG